MHNQQRLVLVIAILASFVAFLDGSVINVALPAITQELGGGISTQQWVVDAYLITLGSLMLLAGSLSDLFGRKKILIWGLATFGVSSVMCALSPTALSLILSRALQGAAGALLVPSSLALLISYFKGPAQGKAIGSWTAWTGIAFLIGPLVGGLLIDSGSWRLIFAINVIPIAVTLWLLTRLPAPKAETSKKRPKIDVIGAIIGSLGLAGPVYALIEQPNYGWGSPIIYVPLILGSLLFGLFVWYERRAAAPMVPPALFKVRNFSVGNVATTFIYAALSIATFLITVFVQQVGNYSALQAGLAFLPVTIIMFVLSGKFGALAGTHGPRLFMAVGPLVAAAGFVSMLFIDSSVNYYILLPGILLFGVGLSITVAPLTAAILGSISAEQAGIGSALNNAVARVAGLVAIAALALIVGGNIDLAGFQRGITVTAGLLALGGIVSALGIRNHEVKAS